MGITAYREAIKYAVTDLLYVYTDLLVSNSGYIRSMIKL